MTDKNPGLSRVSALKTAVQWEKEGLKTYLDYALMTNSETGKNMFIQLARDEHLHMTILEKLIARHETGETQEPIELVESIFQKLRPSLRDIDNYTRGIEETNQIHALEMGMKFESRSRDFFRDMADKAEDEEERAIFRYLEDMEDAHYHILNAQRAGLTDTGTWIEIAPLGMESFIS